MIFRFIFDSQHCEAMRDEQQDHICFLAQFFVAIICQLVIVMADMPK